jgi:alkanesulfonate monooxygenase SsuD/methylene tetrahydromethanopterin reductase-like flavin-dependent oxidoreductase (luciferase family)
MRVCLMIEGQEDVTWEQWRAVAAACEASGFDALMRSDHYVSVNDRRERGSLDAWSTICALSAVTSRIRLGTLVSPVTFRHPSTLAKSVVTADHVSGGGRIELGLGAGWWEAEHELYGFPFPPTRTRMELLAEQLEIVRRQWDEGPFSFHGRHYRIENLDARPKPSRQPNLIVGGRAGRKSAAHAARWADEYNTVFATPGICRKRRAAVAEAWSREGRDPATLRFSLMTGCLIGSDSEELAERARRLAEWTGEDAADPARFLEGLPESWIVGTPPEAIKRLRELADAGVDRVMLQHLLHEDTDAVQLIGREVIPALS